MATQGLELPVTPTDLVLRSAHQPHVFVLDGGSLASWGTGRALFGCRPRATLRVDADGNAVVGGGVAERWRGDPFALLERFRSRYAPPDAAAAEPFAGGLVVALSYDLRSWVEPLPLRRDAGCAPLLHAALYDWLLSYSYVEGRYELASWCRSPGELAAIAAEIEAWAAAPVPGLIGSPPARAECDWSRERYLDAAQRALRYIAAGDIYQVNLAQRFVVSNPPAPAALFAALQRQHPVPFAAYVDGGDFVLVSNSPECFLALEGETLATCPIKGTRPRGTDRAADQRLARQLETDAKERAEHVMIVDLERNDLGRVCRTGSVRVEELARVYTFPSLHHMVSRVAGTVRPGIGLADILRATFPGGSITGAPKIRAMQIIDELEPVARGFYTGAVGFFNLAGDAVFNLAIRTAVAAADQVTYHAGGGIVADSVAEQEYEETLLKAQPFFAALMSTTA